MLQNPYLSVVATARNDNHGGNMLNRMQIFVSGLLQQSHRYQLPIELVLVEWNPPQDTPRLANVLSWAHQSEFCQVRIIEVAPEFHHKLTHAEVLPLFQMIGKNVGIRRAKGDFVLATNIDIVFSDELFQFLATRQLQPQTMYRADRWDVSPFVPVEASLEDQLAFCRSHCLRINLKEGTVIVLPPAQSEPDSVVASADEDLAPSSKWDSIPDSLTPGLSKLRSVYRRLLPKRMKDTVLGYLPADLREWLIERGLLQVQLVPPPPRPEAELVAPVVTPPPRPYPLLHLNGCGDFTLLPRQTWLQVRGYPEFEMHGLHLDSILCHAAYQTGLREHLLAPDQVVYHIEHGRTWFPDWGSETMVSKEEIDRIPKLSLDQLEAIATLMHQLQRPIMFNDEDWGLGAIDLPETQITAQHLLV